MPAATSPGDPSRSRPVAGCPPLDRPPRDFRLSQMALRITQFFPFLMLLPMVVLIVLGLFFVPDLRGAAPILAVVALLLLPLFLWLHSTFARMRASQQEAAARFTAGTCRPCQLENMRYADLNGQVFLVRNFGAPAEAPLFAATLRFSRRVWTVPEKREVRLYLDPARVSPILAIASDTVSGWGEFLTREGLEAGWRQTRRLFLWLLGLIPLSLAVVGWILFQQHQMLEQQRLWAEASQGWPTAEGRVVESMVEETRISSGKSSVQGWQAVVQYEYEVDGLRYPGERIRYGEAPDRDREVIQEIVDRYPAGAAVAVHYDPAVPARSVLEAGHAEELASQLQALRLASLAGGGALLLLLVLPVGVLLYYARRKARLVSRLEALGLFALR